MEGDREEVDLDALERKYGLGKYEGAGPSDGGDPPDSAEDWTPPPIPDPLGAALRFLRIPLWIIAIVAVFYVGGLLWDGIEASAYGGDLNQRWISFAAIAILAASVLALVASYRDERGRERLMPTAVLVALIVGGLGLTLYQSRDNNDELIYDYCAYGAASLSQWFECTKNTAPGEVIYGDSAAADFANGKREDCGPSAGPLCPSAAENRSLREEAAEAESEAFR